MMACSDLAIASAIDPYDFEAWYYQGVAAYLGGKYEHAKNAMPWRCH